MAIGLDDRAAFASLVEKVATPRTGRFAGWQMAALSGILDALDRHQQPLDGLVDSKTQAQIKRVLEAARTVAMDAKARPGDRQTAIGLLGHEKSHRADDLVLLGKLLVPQNAAAIQSAAVAALGRMADDRAAALLLRGWKTYTPALQAQALDLLLSRRPWQPRLLAALEKNAIPPGSVDAARRQRLLRHPDKEIRVRAAGIFASPTNTDRRKVLGAYAGVLKLPGDRTRGKAVFGKRCAVCHRLDGVGHEVGPDLAALANKSPQYLLTEILDPNRNVDSRFVEYTASTKTGRSFTGLLAAETATSVTLRGQEGKEQVLLRSDLEELTSTGRSLMPEGLEKDLTRQDLVDVIAYLMPQDPPPKHCPGNQPAIVKPVKGRYALLASNAAIHGAQITFEQPFQNIGYWHGANDRVVWTVAVAKAATFDVWLDWACDDSVAGNAYVFEGGKEPLRGKVAGTGGWDKYRQRKIGTVGLAAGTQRLTLRPDGESIRGALLDLRGIYLVPAGQKPVIAGASR
jgi:putative heme-binding domain-containing protein